MQAKIKYIIMDSKTNATESIPEYVEGIPTAKKRSIERFELIMNYYKSLWKILQKEGRTNSKKMNSSMPTFIS